MTLGELQSNDRKIEIELGIQKVEEMPISMQLELTAKRFKSAYLGSGVVEEKDF